MKLTGEQFQQLEQAVCKVFDLGGLRRLVRFGLDQKLESLVDPKGKLPVVVFALIKEVERAGWIEQFVRAVHNARPENEEVKSFCDAYARFIYEPPPSPDRLQKSVSAGLSVLQELVGAADREPIWLV